MTPFQELLAASSTAGQAVRVAHLAAARSIHDYEMNGRNPLDGAAATAAVGLYGHVLALQEAAWLAIGAGAVDHFSLDSECLPSPRADAGGRGEASVSHRGGRPLSDAASPVPTVGVAG